MRNQNLRLINLKQNKVKDKDKDRELSITITEEDSIIKTGVISTEEITILIPTLIEDTKDNSNLLRIHIYILGGDLGLILSIYSLVPIRSPPIKLFMLISP